MKLSVFKKQLTNLEELNFELPNGELVPNHYHVTEVGSITKKFIDCGGTIREESVVSLQLWYAKKDDHRLAPQKLLDIITLSENKLGIQNHEVEVEYQSDTIGKYGVRFDGQNFVLTSKATACLALDACVPSLPNGKPLINLSNLVSGSNSGSCCTPSSGNCC
ncbi:MAG: DUF6428 family protein [Chitinophagales bacterium]